MLSLLQKALAGAPKKALNLAAASLGSRVCVAQLLHKPPLALLEGVTGDGVRMDSPISSQMSLLGHLHLQQQPQISLLHPPWSLTMDGGPSVDKAAWGGCSRDLRPAPGMPTPSLKGRAGWHGLKFPTWHYHGLSLTRKWIWQVSRNVWKKKIAEQPVLTSPGCKWNLKLSWDSSPSHCTATALKPLDKQDVI